jgi:NAD(P)H-dependent FMN reductase
MEQVTPNDASFKILLFPASLRQCSYQSSLVNHLAEILPNNCQRDILQPQEVTLPLFNQDLEDLPEIRTKVSSLHHRFNNANGLIIASPEYNGHVSPYLKNTLDWISRLSHIDPHYIGTSPFYNKPVLLACATTGWTGGLLGLQNVRSIFSYLGALVQAEQICLPNADHVFVNAEAILDPLHAASITNTVASFVSLVLRTL